MRVNVYSQEMNGEHAIVEKVSEGKRYYGLRLFLHSPEQLHHSAADDDRSAVTIWCASDGRTWDRFALADLLVAASATLRKAPKGGEA